MKKHRFFKWLVALLISMSALRPFTVKAATLIVYPDKNEAEVGDMITFTVTVSGGAGYVNISGVVNDSMVWLEDSSKSYTVEATEAGTMTIQVDGVIADNELEEDQPLSDSAIVVIKEKSNNTGNNGGSSGNSGGSTNNGSGSSGNNGYVEPEPEPEPVKSSDARLYSLSVDKGSLSPAFSSGITEYTVELTSKETEIRIYAETWDDNASLSGTGLKPIKVGSNSFTIDVEAEDGTRKAYTINVNVKELPSIYLTLDDQKLGILNDVENADIPKGFMEKTIEVQDQQVKAYVNEKETMTLLWMVNESDQKGFYIYSEEKGSLQGLYRPVIIDGKEYYPLTITESMQTRDGMKYATVSVEEETMNGWLFEDEKLQNYTLLYLMNTEGQNGFYVYDVQEKKLMAYPEEAPVTYEAFQKWLGEDTTPWLLYGGIAAIVIIIVAILVFLWKKRKQRPDDKKPSDPSSKSGSQRHHKLVTDDTFFGDVPEAEMEHPDFLTENGVPLSIENALKGIDQSDQEKTIVATKTSATDDDDWLDEKLVQSVLPDDEE